VKM
jgi:hypothetical protein